MTFSIALSGLSAASNNLAVTGNNIANANTVGFKKSRAEFADIYASSLGGVSNIQPGAGVKVVNDAQQFNQGALNFTENNLDLAISGEGFFTLANSPTETTNLSYTRDGEFKLDKDGYIVNNQGRALLAYTPNGTTVADGFSTGVTKPVQINTLTGLPSSTDTVALAVNLNASEASPLDAVPPLAFDPTNAKSYNAQTSTTIYDSLGNQHTLTTYFVKQTPGAASTDWNVYHYMDGTANPVDAGTYGTAVAASGAAPPAPGVLTFDTNGKLTTPANGRFALAPYTITPATGAADINIATMDYTDSTQVQQKFSVNTMTQNGLAAGRLTGVDIDKSGVIFARFSNGGSKPVGQVALTRFPSNNGLSKIGDTAWAQSANSGLPILGVAGGNNFGLIQSGALESSNVDLSAQLVNLIVAQQAYQANAQTITTENTIMNTILQIR